MKKLRKEIKILFIVVIALAVLVCGLLVTYNYLLSAVSKESDKVNFTINSGDTTQSIVNNLKDANLIRNEFVTLVYIKLHGNLVLQAGNYSLSRDMSVKDIIQDFANGNVIGATMELTFYEGKRITDYVKIISDATGMNYDDCLKDINNKKFIEQLINEEKYWFLTDDILNDKIYYALEGYLFPDTYQFYKNASLEEIVKTMLNNTANKLEKLKEQIQNNELTIHEIFTLASLVESEAKTASDRAMVAGVFMNRMRNGISLGSDVTTYYAVGKNFGDGLTFADLGNCDNGYNTNHRCTNNKGLSVGPISNPSLSAIEAAINPTPNEYFYFVADCTGKTYFNVNENGHNQTISKLISENNWCE